MRRGRIFVLFALAIAACSFGFATNARADDSTTPQAICTDLQDGTLDGTYTAAEYQAFLSDPTVQGYCGAIVPPTVCAAGATMNSAGQCVATPTPTPPTTPQTPTPQTPGPPVSLTPAPRVPAVVRKSRRTTVTKGSRHTVSSQPVSAPVTPLATTKPTGSLPFTGAELALFAFVGLALIGTGLLLRTTARQRS